jgi:DNA-binding NtrC family response regulator
MTPPRPKVLSIGVDATLLETRNRVLESAGFDVITSFPALNGGGHIENHDFNLAVLGDSLPRALAVTILQQLKRSRPFIPVVVIYKGGDFCDDFAEADATCGSLDGPEHLIRTISTLIGYSPASVERPLRRDAAAD